MEKIIIVGDLFPVQSNLEKFSKGDVHSLFGGDICELFSKANLRICNLEGTLTNKEERCEKTGPVICAPTSAVNAYKGLGIDYCMLANNHITDGGHQGVIDTMKVLDNTDIKYIGAGLSNTSIPHSTTLSIGSNKVCLYNVCERMYNKPSAKKAGAWLYDEYVVCKELEELKRNCNYLIIIYHGGIEKFRYPSPEIKKRFHRMADSGADVILSQHTHCIGCEEYYNGTYLLYGQGDFLLKNFRPEITETGLIIELVFSETGLRVQKHMVKCTKDFCLEYIKVPDLSEFIMRSGKVQNDDYLLEQFQHFCELELQLYLTAFKSPGKFIRKVRQYFPNLFQKWLFTQAYSRHDLMFTLHTLRSEQNREIAIAGIEELLKRNN